MIAAPHGGFIGPVKRSVTIAGHATSVSLEPVFWAALERAAVAHALPLSALVAHVDALRIAQDEPPNLASALRSYLADNPEHFATNMRSGRISVDSESHSQ
ncbi:putative DNA-binding ribbon-helix-helix protein [Sphingomonas endophytica]|uniref:Putative DNA-binding ribbon-helix-helix protein n=1 Tax=Sphingomonas endophytica TaxID=869719 RepID=A0A7X0JFZ2_9SPHN|nr:ribbon-helix-helix domain-containing protein [Sphingomonas endophytica]MBB6506529.1 putative DNA-binding ribbon-helix-helix protein [Sphingomonas endophytica]